MTEQYNYGLYQTLNYESPEDDLSSSKKKRLVKKLNNLTDTQKEAILLLICEHARLHNSYMFDPSDPKLPYKLSFKTSEFKLDIDKLPIKLRWILNKFMDVVNTN